MATPASPRPGNTPVTLRRRIHCTHCSIGDIVGFSVTGGPWCSARQSGVLRVCHHTASCDPANDAANSGVGARKRKSMTGCSLT
jgi:hypothetical protein